LEPQLTDKAFRKRWARLIQKIYEVDPLVCSSCGGAMRVIAFIEDQDVIRKILTHLGLRQIKHRPKPVAHGPPDITCQPFSVCRPLGPMGIRPIRSTPTKPNF
jgi:hypothetical protein